MNEQGNPPEAMNDADELRAEVLYLRRLVESNAARLLTTDMQSIAIRHELEQKRLGFRLMAELAVTLGQEADYESAFVSVSRRINATLNMQRTAVLFPEGGSGFRAKVLQGYSAEEKEAISGRHIAVIPEFLDPLHPVLITSEDPITRLGSLREALLLPYLIAAPVILNGDVAAVQTVSAYLAAMLAEHRLRQAETLAKHDPLTHLPNLRGTNEQLHHTLAIARRGGFYAATMFVDLDGFKAVNDTFGHAVGDIVLQIVAERLTACVRESDFVGRIGGDEFIVVLSHVRRPEDAGTVARKIIEKIGKPINACGAHCHVGASVGIAIFPDHGSDEAALIRMADEAMYSVKSSGKNSFAYAKR